MGQAVSASRREMVLAFDPSQGESVAAFCARLKISRATFYRLRERAAVEGAAAALVPRSRAPLVPSRVYSTWTDQVIEVAWRQLSSEGWEHGPWSVWWRLQQEGVEPCPSRSTIARRLRVLGLAKVSPGKRPRSSFTRFQRSLANELWQIDGMVWQVRGELVTIYQIVDDCTRLIVALLARAGGETAQGAVAALQTAVESYGLPAAVLSDNGLAFNQHRRGKTALTEQWLADRGVRPISSRVGHPQTQGKVERAHQPVANWLNARDQPDTVAELNQLLDTFRHHYNHFRQHQGIGLRTTPAMAWESVAKAGPLDHPIDLAELYGKQPLSLPPAPQQSTFQTREVKAGGRLGYEGIVLQFEKASTGATFHFIRHRDHVEIYDSNGELFAHVPWPPPRKTPNASINPTKKPYRYQHPQPTS